MPTRRGATRPVRGLDAARAPHNCTRELALHHVPARGRWPWKSVISPPTQPPRAQSRAPPSQSVSSVVFFWSEAARALAPSAPMLLSARRAQHLTTRQASRRQEEEPRARQGDPTPHARRTTARPSSLCIVRPRAAAARGTAPHPPSPASASTEPRTSEDELIERRVLLERGRQSSRAAVADLIDCGAHSTQPTASVTPTRRSHAPGKRTRRRTRAAQLHARARSASCACARPPAVGPRHTSPFPSHRKHRAAHRRG
jgi:hypothetical protein